MSGRSLALDRPPDLIVDSFVQMLLKETTEEIEEDRFVGVRRSFKVGQCLRRSWSYQMGAGVCATRCLNVPLSAVRK